MSPKGSTHVALFLVGGFDNAIEIGSSTSTLSVTRSNFINQLNIEGGGEGTYLVIEQS